MKDKYEDQPESEIDRKLHRKEQSSNKKASESSGNLDNLSEEELARRIRILKKRRAELEGKRLKKKPIDESAEHSGLKEKNMHRRRVTKSSMDHTGKERKRSQREKLMKKSDRDSRTHRGSDNNFEDKKERFVSGKSSGSKGIFKTVGVLVLILGVVGGIFFSSRRGPAIDVERSIVSDPIDYSTTGKIEMTQIKAEETGDSVVIPLDDVKENKIVGFEYSKVAIPSGFGAARPFPLVAYIAPSGKLVTGVSLCEPCKGTLFYIDSADVTLTCKVCETKWNLETLEGISGGCPQYPPDEFQHTIKDGKVYIKASQVESWKPRI